MKVKLQSLLDALCMTDSQIADEVQKMSGQIITRDLINRAVDGAPIPALKAQALCDWLSTEFGRTINPADISDLNIHSFSSLPEPADAGKGSVPNKTEKIEGFVAGFNLAYAARFNNQVLSNDEVYKLAEQATAKHMSVFQESAEQAAVSRDAFHMGYTFAGNAVTVMFGQPGGDQKFRELKAMNKGQREQYARNMARQYLRYL